MAGTSSLQEKLKQGIEAARRGDKLTAQRLLRQVVESDRNNEVAWMWFASSLENLEERRSALEQALRINPENARAQEALRQLEAVLPPTTTRRTGRTAQRTTGALPRIGPGDGLSGTTLIVIGAVIGLVVIVLVIFGLVSSNQQTTITNASTLAAQQSVLLNTDVPPATIDPDTYTATPFYGVIVTANQSAANFPATFTATFTPSPTVTPPATATLFPLANFTILFTTASASDAQPALFQMKGDGTGVQPLGSAADGYNDVAYAPNGQLIAFVRTVTYDKDGTSVTSPELFVSPPNNPGAARQLTHAGATHLATPAWEADSVQLLFVSNMDGDDEIWYITEDGNNLRQITQSDGVDKDPVWSPDGTMIVFASERANFIPEGANLGLTEIFSMTADGATTVQLTDDQGSSYTPSFSPDGQHITFASDRSGKGNIYVMDPNGDSPSRLTLDPNSENRQPAFTPNGKSIIFLSNLAGDNFQFYSMDANGNSVTRLVDPGNNIQSFAFLPLPLTLFNQ